MNDFPFGWQVKSLGEVSEVIRGITFTPNDKVEKEDKGAIPCLRTSNVQFKVDWDDLIYIPRHLVKDKERLLREGDTLVSTANSKDLVGKCAFIDELKFESTLGGFISAIRPNQKYIDPSFLFHYLTQASVRAYLKKVSRQTTNIANLSIPDLLSLRIPLPPLPIQKQIAGILEKADEAKQKRKEANQLTDEFLQSAFIEMFGDPVKNQKRWEVKELDELGKMARGKSKHRPRNAPFLLGGKYPLIQTGEIVNSSVYIKDYSQTYSEEGLKQSKIWPKGTLCISIAANIGFTAILSFDACFPDSVVGFVPDKKVIIEYINFYFKFIQSQLEEIAPQAAQKNINLEILGNLKVPVPPISLQQQFAEIVNKTEALKEKQKQSEQELENLFQSLMQRAFKGEFHLPNSTVR
ncbi:MAG: hypothetical protein A2V93_10215 [Ignavibacteria bacterium RBG_16_34_14]|nr:MAG: hypothetical protein A2V93_10215 [Ignavibacteria bacterium RBG_16_34_14]